MGLKFKTSIDIASQTPIKSPVVSGETICASTCFIGSGAGLTGTAASLTAGSANSLSIVGDNKIILDSDGDCWSYLVNDTTNNYGFGANSVIASSAAERYVFYAQETSGLSDIVAGQICGTNFIGNGAGLTGLTGGGDVSKVGTPLICQVAVWTGDGTVCGGSTLRMASSTLYVENAICTTGAIVAGTNITACANYYLNAGANRAILWNSTASGNGCGFYICGNQGNTTNNGGGIYIHAGCGGTTSGIGAIVQLCGGRSVSGSGGGIQIIGGASSSGSGGGLYFAGGNSTGTNGSSVQIVGGFTSSVHRGGDITICGGGNQTGVGSQPAGDAYICGGYNDGSGAGGKVYIVGGTNVDESVFEDIILNPDGGNVGVGKVPTTALDVNGVVTATSFVGSAASLTGTITCASRAQCVLSAFDTYVNSSSGFVGITYAGSVKLFTVTNGICLCSHCGFAVDWVATSDCRLKENVKPISNALSIVNNLCGVCYQLCDDVNNENRIGLIAQDVEQYLPEVVSRSGASEEDKKYGIDDEKLGLKYDKLTAVLIEAVKEQQTIINKLDDRIKSLEKNK